MAVFTSFVSRILRVLPPMAAIAMQAAIAKVRRVFFVRVMRTKVTNPWYPVNDKMTWQETTSHSRVITSYLLLGKLCYGEGPNANPPFKGLVLGPRGLCGPGVSDPLAALAPLFWNGRPIEGPARRCVANNGAVHLTDG